MGVLPAGMIVCQFCSVLEKARKGVRSAETGVIDGCETQYRC